MELVSVSSIEEGTHGPDSPMNHATVSLTVNSKVGPMSTGGRSGSEGERSASGSKKTLVYKTPPNVEWQATIRYNDGMSSTVPAHVINAWMETN